MSKLCCVDQSRIDMDGPQGRITEEDLVASGTFSQAVKNHRHWNTGTCGTQLAAANLGISDQMFAPVEYGTVHRRRCEPYPYRNTSVAVERTDRPGHDDSRLER